jgi:ankyrin repeat protein
MLLEKGANRTIAYPDGSTALTLATANKHEDIVKLLSNYESNHFG